jgi:hypothetical protein
MAIFDPPRAGRAGWQLPWLRLSLILRSMAADSDCRDEDLAELEVMRRRIAQRGWFN